MCRTPLVQSGGLLCELFPGVVVEKRMLGALARLAGVRSHSRDGNRPSLRACVVGYDTDEAGSGYVVYRLRVKCGSKVWMVKRRFSDFRQLHSDLLQNIPRKLLPSPPPKFQWRIFDMDGIFYEERQWRLQHYLLQLLAMRGALGAGEETFLSFLDVRTDLRHQSRSHLSALPEAQRAF
mmetsp:Transcript_20424/g.54715  ORF Transcript_20424/g.54715 Transcript_20424/m.54715 type:complete len:179 (-) Transcript_20424:268-804(-)